VSEFGNAPVATQANPEDKPVFLRSPVPRWFTCVPNATNTLELAVIGRQFWQYTAMETLSYAAQGLGENVGHLLKAVADFNTEQRLHPRLNARLGNVMASIERRDGYSATDELQAWCSDSPESWYAAKGITVESIATHAWERALLHEIRSHQVPETKAPGVFPMLERPLLPHEKRIEEVMRMIREVDPAMHHEIAEHVSLVKLFTGRGIEGLSTPKAFGAIWLQAPEPENAISWYLEHLVHECSHLHLNLLMVLDPLMTNPNDLNEAPIRPDPRPMFQILHGTFVLARNCRTHRRVSAEYPELGLTEAVKKFEEQFLKGLEVLTHNMKPTELGHYLIDTLKEEANSIQ
jgi:HEXXH motif-containing protein